MKTGRARELTRGTFQDYGYVISEAIGRPFGKTMELTYWRKVSLLKMGKTISTGVLYGHRRRPIVKKLERHSRTPEILVALEGDPVICFGKPSDGAKVRSIRAFRVKEGDAVAMHPGTWHWLPFPARISKCKFLVMFAADTETSDLEIRNLPEEVRIARL